MSGNPALSLLLLPARAQISILRAPIVKSGDDAVSLVNPRYPHSSQAARADHKKKRQVSAQLKSGDGAGLPIKLHYPPSFLAARALTSISASPNTIQLIKLNKILILITHKKSIFGNIIYFSIFLCSSTHFLKISIFKSNF